jgi:hypothetical protein
MASFFNLETFWRDARHGTRMLRKNPTYAAVAVLTLALGIGKHRDFQRRQFRSAEAVAFQRAEPPCDYLGNR